MAAVGARTADWYRALSEAGWDPALYAANAGFVPALGEAALALLAPRPGERILDLGCGDGALTRRLVEAGAVVTGLDRDPAMLAAAAARGLAVIRGDGCALAFSGAFDAVFSNAALHWMTDGDAVARGVFEALVPGGRFVGECGGHGNVAAIRAGMRALAERRGEPWAEVQRYDSAERWSTRLVAAGFVEIEARLIARPTALPTGIAGWLRTFRGGFVPHGTDPDAFVSQVESFLAPMLRDDEGRWTADYVRLRFAARRPR